MGTQTVNQMPGNPLILRDGSGDTLVDRIAGAIAYSNDNGATWIPLGQNPLSFAEETKLLAQILMPDRAFNRCVGTDFVPIWEASLSATGTPVIDAGAPPPSAFGGGVVKFSATAGQLALNPTTPGGATYNPILGSFESMATPWAIRGKALLNFTAFTSATNLVLASLDNSTTGVAAGTHSIQLLSAGSTHAQQLFVQLKNAAGNGPLISCGPDGILGGANSYVVPNQWFWYTLYFDGVSIRWAFNDQFNPANRLDATGTTPGIGNMDNMPNDATAVVLSNTDTTNGANIYVDALAFAYCATVGNK